VGRPRDRSGDMQPFDFFFFSTITGRPEHVGARARCCAHPTEKVAREMRLRARPPACVRVQVMDGNTAERGRVRGGMG